MEMATNELNRAIKSARSARKRRWCIAVVVLVLIGVLVGVIMLVVVPKLKQQ